MLDHLTGRALLEAIGALAENPPRDARHDKRELQRPARLAADYTTPFSLLGRRAPCRHCRTSLPCLKHAKY